MENEGHQFFSYFFNIRNSFQFVNLLLTRESRAGQGRCIIKWWHSNCPSNEPHYSVPAGLLLLLLVTGLTGGAFIRSGEDRSEEIIQLFWPNYHSLDQRALNHHRVPRPRVRILVSWIIGFRDKIEIDLSVVSYSWTWASRPLNCIYFYKISCI